MTDMRSFYAELDVFVLPSLSAEGLPLTILEAMAMSRPVIATRVAGPPEAMGDGLSEWLVPPDDEGSLAGCLARLAADPALRGAIGLAARRRIENRFTLQRSVGEIEEAYRALLQEDRASRAAATP